MKKNEIPLPPRGKLSKEARGLWRQILEEWDLDQTGQLILCAALEAHDRMREAQAELKKNGSLILPDRFGQEKSHPAVAIERDSRAAMLQGLKALGVDLEPLNDTPGRPPQKGK